MVLIADKKNKKEYGNIDFTDLGNKIAEIREKRGLKQEKLAEKVGVSRKTISNWETAKKKPRLQDLLKLCDELSCDLDCLLGRSPYSTKEIKTVCEYTGLSEKTVKTLHQFSKLKEGSNIPVFLSDLFDNYNNFDSFLFTLEDFLTDSYIANQAAANYNDKADFRDSIMKHIKYNDKSAVMLLQCQRLIDSLKEDVDKSEYIQSLVTRSQKGYATIITDENK